MLKKNPELGANEFSNNGNTAARVATVSPRTRRLALLAAGLTLAPLFTGCAEPVTGSASAESSVTSTTITPTTTSTTTPLLSGTPYQEPLVRDATVFSDWRNGGTGKVGQIGVSEVDTIGVACVEYDGPKNRTWYELEGGQYSGNFIDTRDAYNNGAGNTYDPYVPKCDTNPVPLPPAN